MWVYTEHMIIEKWSVVPTADDSGLALKPLDPAANQYEVCVGVRDGAIYISVYVDGVDEPVNEFIRKMGET